MKAFKIAMILPGLLLAAGVLWAAPQYGEALIQQGSMTIVREGRTLSFEKSDTAVPVNEEDLIRVRPDSLVQLKSRENATITLGSNAVFQVKPWQSHGKSGFLRALFGRFRAAVVGLSGGEQFNVKTATATIGVKGTEYNGQVTSGGGTLLIVTNHTVGFQGQRGGERDVHEGFVSLILNFQPPTPPVPTPPGLHDLYNNLNSPQPNSPEGGDFAGQILLISAGVTTQKDLDEGKNTSSGGTGGLEPGQQYFVVPSFDPNAGTGAVQRARVPLNFQP